jgi:hypothetical protein
MLMNATPTSMAQLVLALAEALPTQYRPCVPTPRDGKIHISIGYVPPAQAPAPTQPTTALCGDGATVIGSSVVTSFVICADCWEDFLNRTLTAPAAATAPASS